MGPTAGPIKQSTYGRGGAGLGFRRKGGHGRRMDWTLDRSRGCVDVGLPSVARTPEGRERVGCYLQQYPTASTVVIWLSRGFHRASTALSSVSSPIFLENEINIRN